LYGNKKKDASNLLEEKEKKKTVNIHRGAMRKLNTRHARNRKQYSHLTKENGKKNE
jgi:hypothetical protein